MVKNCSRRSARKWSRSGRVIAVMFVAHVRFLSGQEAVRTENSRDSIPFVGCSSDGQTGPIEAPTYKIPAFSLSAEQAEKLAYYKSENSLGVLAPRDWHCFGTYGSGGNALYV